MTQTLLPDSTVSAGSWSPSTATNLTADDGTYCISEAVSNAPTTTLEVGLDNGVDPAVSIGHLIRVRWFASGGGGAFADAVCELVQGTTIIATLSSASTLGTTEVEETLILSGGEADSITDYSDLRLRLRATNARRSLHVDLARFEIPDASISGSLAETEDNDSMSASGSVAASGVAGSISETQDAQTIAASGTSTDPPLPGNLPTAAAIAIYDARNTAGSVDDPVTNWSDEGPKGQDPLNQDTAGSKPTINESGFGGIRALLFDGTDDFMTVTLDQSYTGDYAIIIVMEWVTLHASQDEVVYSTGSVPNKTILGQDPPNGWVIMSGTGDPGEHYTGTNDATYMEDTPSRFVMTQFVENDNRLRLYENGVIAIDEAPASVGDLNDMGALTLGARESQDRNGNIRVAYILLVDMAETDLATLLDADDDLGTAFAVPGYGTSLVGSISETEGADTMSASGSSAVVGSVAETEEDDSSTASGVLSVSGSLSEVEEDDSVSSTGALASEGALAETAEDDTIAASGQLGAAGSLNETSADDSMSAAGTSTPPDVSGSLSETSADHTMAASGTSDSQTIAGSLAETAESQTSSAAGNLSYEGSLAENEEDDASASAGHLSYSGALTENSEDDSMSAVGATANNIGSLAETEEGSTMAASGAVIFSGSVSETEENDTVVASGTVKSEGSLAETQDDNTMDASGTSTSLGIAGSLDETQDEQTIVASGVVVNSGALSETQEDQIVSAQGAVEVSGTVSELQEDQTVVASGGLGSSGSVSISEEDDSSTSTGQLGYSGTTSADENDDSMSASGTIVLEGAVVVSAADQTMTSNGTTNALPFNPVQSFKASVTGGVPSDKMRTRFKGKA